MTGTAQITPIQPILGPGYARPSGLYLMEAHRAPGVSGPLPWSLDAGDVIDANSYINMLMPDVWLRHTPVRRFGVRIQTGGRVSVRISGVCLPQGRGPLHRTIGHSEGSGELLVWVPEGQADANTRLYVTVVALEAGEIAAIDWVTDTPPVIEPRLSIGICTFNREEQLAQALQALDGQADRTPEIARVWVVNQGPSFGDPALTQLQKSPLIEVIEQGNLGGCGGFARTMSEAMACDLDLTHHLLMDDDIVLDPRMIDRVIHFLRYSGDAVAVGGQMLEIERPVILHELGVVLDPMTYVNQIKHNVPIHNPLNLDAFTETPRIDYNAWWFNAIPLSAIRKVGLPPPLFIRGDDIEYACRLAKAGTETVPLIGTVIWHESFEFKHSGWLAYYNLRNRILLSILHPEKIGNVTGLYVLGYVMAILCQHRYRAMHLALLAADHALGAPADGLPSDAAGHHAAIVSEIDLYPGPEILHAEDLPPSVPGTPLPLDLAVGPMVRMCVWSGIAVHLNRIVLRKKPLRFRLLPSGASVQGRSYIHQADPEGRQFRLYRPRLRAYWPLLFRALKLYFTFDRRIKSAMAANPAKIDELRGQKAWDAAFKLPRG